MKNSKILYVPSGSTSKIITHLNKYNYELNYFDTILIDIIGSPQSGWIDLGRKNLSKIDFMIRLVTSKAALTSVILIPGETTYFFLHQLADKFKLDYNLLNFYHQKYGKYREGNIIAETYYIPYGMSEENLIKYLLLESQKNYKKFSLKFFGHYNPNEWKKYIIIASIIEKEAANIEEMPIIAAVIKNRIIKNMRLQMDGTLNYGKFSHTAVTSEMIKNNKSIYNTYKIKSLPIEPVCNVSINSIRAALNPSNVDYLYFVKGPNETHLFTKSYTQHLLNIRSVKK